MSWLQHVVAAPPAVEPIAIEHGREQVNVEADNDEHDVALNLYIEGARAHVEDYTGQKLITQTVLLRCSCWADLACLPIAPIQEIVSIKYLDADGAEQTLAATVYEAVLPGKRPEIRLKLNQVWPTVRPVSDAIRVEATAGFGAAAANVPMPIRQAILLLIGDWFDHREDSGDRLTEMPHGVAALLRNHRI